MEILKKLIFKYTPFGAPKYHYNIEPIQLVSFVNEIERLRNTSGSIVEIGVARGLTTRFICEHIRGSGYSESLKYFALDTFSSFTKEDVDFEVDKRGKRRDELVGFGYNDFDVWCKNFLEFDFLKPIKADCSTYDYRQIGPLKLAFLDVDLYMPTKNALPLIFEQLVPGGVILVDDCLANNRWDGAFQAYQEFCFDNNIPATIIGRKCGYIQKPT